MEIKHEVSIVIPVYALNKKIVELTQKCLQSLVKFTPSFECVIIDNGSPLEVAYHFQPDILVKNKENKGNASAWNQGARLANGSIIIFMDNDVEVTKEWLQPLTDLLKRETVGVAFPLSKNGDEDDFNAKLAGFCWAIRRETFDKVGEIDEGYGLGYFEDTDYWMRLKQYKYKLHVAPQSRVRHVSRGTSRYMPGIAALYERNKQCYERRWTAYPKLDG